MIPSCHVPWTWFEIDLEKQKIRSCCKTDWLDDTDNKKFLNEIIIERRKNFIQGNKDPSCSYCWTIEDRGQISYRHYVKANTYLQTTNFDISISVPKTLSINLGSLCNISCSYCNEYYSTVWAAEKHIPIKLNHDNFFNDKVLTWLEKIIVDDHLKHIIIIGGEPTINPFFYKILDLVNLISNKRSDRLLITVQTNGLFSSNNLDKIISTNYDKFKFSYRFSIDALYERAEFIRTGLKWSTFENNLASLIKHKNKNFEVALHPTLSIYNLGGLEDFLHWADKLSNNLPDLGFNHVDSPEFMALKTLGKECSNLFKITTSFKNFSISNYVKRSQEFINGFTSDPNIDLIRKGIEIQELRSKISARQAVPELIKIIENGN